jgi:hypothetical protein
VKGTKGAFVALLLLVAMPSVIFAGGKSNLKNLAKDNAGKTIAVVSLSANNYGNSLQGWNEANSSSLMASKLNVMLTMVELNLSKDWKVVKADTFIEKDAFQKLAGDMRDVGVPEKNGKKLPLFGTDRKQLIKASVNADTVKQIAAITGTDYVVVIYSEWAIAVGKMIPTSKALAKNVMSVYDKDGKQAFTGRSDKLGSKTIGAMGVVKVDETTIDQWVEAYLTGINALIGE